MKGAGTGTGNMSVTPQGKRLTVELPGVEGIGIADMDQSPAKLQNDDRLLSSNGASTRLLEQSPRPLTKIDRKKSASFTFANEYGTSGNVLKTNMRGTHQSPRQLSGVESGNCTNSRSGGDHVIAANNDIIVNHGPDFGDKRLPKPSMQKSHSAGESRERGQGGSKGLPSLFGLLCCLGGGDGEPHCPS